MNLLLSITLVVYSTSLFELSSFLQQAAKLLKMIASASFNSCSYKGKSSIAASKLSAVFL